MMGSELGAGGWGSSTPAQHQTAGSKKESSPGGPLQHGEVDPLPVGRGGRAREGAEVEGEEGRGK